MAERNALSQLKFLESFQKPFSLEDINTSDTDSVLSD